MLQQSATDAPGTQIPVPQRNWVAGLQDGVIIYARDELQVWATSPTPSQPENCCGPGGGGEGCFPLGPAHQVEHRAMQGGAFAGHRAVEEDLVNVIPVVQEGVGGHPPV